MQILLHSHILPQADSSGCLARLFANWMPSIIVIPTDYQLFGYNRCSSRRVKFSYILCYSKVLLFPFFLIVYFILITTKFCCGYLTLILNLRLTVSSSIPHTLPSLLFPLSSFPFLPLSLSSQLQLGARLARRCGEALRQVGGAARRPDGGEAPRFDIFFF